MFVYDYTIILEAFAFLPQLVLMRKIQEVEIITGGYLFCLGIYRAIYEFSWFWRWYENVDSFRDMYIKVIFGLIQTALYADFLWRYIKAARSKERKVPLPI